METIKNTIAELGYTLIAPRVLKAISYNVPQKRERLILIGIRNDYADKVKFIWPSPYKRIVTLRDAFFAGDLYPTDVPESPYQKYPEKKQKVLAMVPQGGDWRDLPEEVQKEYMGASFYLGGGKTGMARRLSLDEPSLTLTCAPAQKQTERCHPTETRPLTVREYARIQTFPDEWKFAGNLSEQYKQIGNPVPVNLAWTVGRAIIRLLNQIDNIDKECNTSAPNAEKASALMGLYIRQLSLFEPDTLYISNDTDRPTLIGACRAGVIQWIEAANRYNYPITDDDILAHPELFNVKNIFIRHKKKPIGYFIVNNVQIVNKSDLKLLGYPTRSSRHKSDTKYILYDITPISTGETSFDIEKFRPILGTGVK